jgi:putative heme-binding domain-containing protein
VAFRALRRANQDVLATCQRMSADPSAAIRREVAVALRDVPLAQSKDALVAIARQFDGKDRAYLEAFGIGCFGKESEIYAALAPDLGKQPWSAAFARIAWRLGSPEAVNDFKTRALAKDLDRDQRKLMVDALAFVPVAEAAKAMVTLAATENYDLHEETMWWLNNRQHNEWREFNVVPMMKEHGLIKERPLVSMVSPEPPTGSSKLPPAADILALRGNEKTGATAAAACFSCHKIGTQGIEFGPELTQFAKTQPREVILNSIVNPSADIAHGFEGTRIETNDGLTIDGIVVDAGDPVVIKSMGGQVQNVPRSRIKTEKPLGRSLMISGEALGLTAQGLADIIAYLETVAGKKP